MIFEEWARRWHIPPEALQDLTARLGACCEPEREYTDATTENGVQQRVRIEASRNGGRLWRNNCGVHEQDGRFIRYGLCNDSARINRSMKSSDLIGITPVTITEEHVGTIVGRFTAVEVKKPGWTYRGTEREQAQLKFIKLINLLGGVGRFVS